jgi:hypothetical protein
MCSVGSAPSSAGALVLLLLLLLLLLLVLLQVDHLCCSQGGGLHAMTADKACAHYQETNHQNFHRLSSRRAETSHLHFSLPKVL